MTYSIQLCSVTQLASDDPDRKVQRCYMSVLWDGLRSVLPASEIGTGPSMRTDPNRRENLTTTFILSQTGAIYCTWASVILKSAASLLRKCLPYGQRSVDSATTRT